MIGSFFNFNGFFQGQNETPQGFDQDEKQVLYNYVTNILLDRLIRSKTLGNEKNIHLIAAKRETSKFLNINFKDYLKKNSSKSHSPFIRRNHLALSAQRYSSCRYAQLGNFS